MSIWSLLVAVCLAGASAAVVVAQDPDSKWRLCPRCVTREDRAAARERVKGLPFNPRDLAGPWGEMGAPNGFTGAMPPLTEEAKAKAAKLPNSGPGNFDPVRTCDPWGVPRILTYNYGFEFVQLHDRIIQFFELTHTWRTIWMDGRQLPKNPPLGRWMGYAIGRWEGDTLVVESSGFDDRAIIAARDYRELGVPRTPASVLFGVPHSDEMRTTERIRRAEYGVLEIQLTVEDPRTFTKPWTSNVLRVGISPNTELWEDYCVPSEQREFEQLEFGADAN